MPNLQCILYCQKHLYVKLEVADFKYDNSFSLKATKSSILWYQSYGFLILHETLHFDKFDDADFKYDSSFSNLEPKISK